MIKTDPGRAFAEAQITEHTGALLEIDARVTEKKAEIDDIEAQITCLYAQRELHQRLKDQAHRFLEAQDLPAPAPPKPRAKPGEVEAAVREAVKGYAYLVVTAAADIAAATQHPEGSVSAVLRRLRKAGALKVEGDRYVIKSAIEAVGEQVRAETGDLLLGDAA